MTGDSAVFLMLDRETRLPLDVFHPVDHPEFRKNEYIIDLQERMQSVRELFRAWQTGTRVEEGVVPLFNVGDRVWLKSSFRGNVQSYKLNLWIIRYQMYEMEKGEKETIQHEGWIKLYVAEDKPVSEVGSRH